MSFDESELLRRIGELESKADPPKRLIIALSGGLDSSVLLHALAGTRDRHGHPLVAVHIDHGLQEDSARWSRHCEAFAGSLGVEFVSEQVNVDRESGLGLEAAARAARYEAFGRLMTPYDWLLSAHHQDDQAETLLLNLMRGSGLTGLSGMQSLRPFAAGWLARPMLDVSRKEIEAYAAANAVEFIDDPSNADTAHDRNFLRHEVIPLLESRWQGGSERIRRSARLANEASELLGQLADVDGRTIVAAGGKMMISNFRELSEPRQRNLLRHTLASLDLPLPGARQLAQILRELVPAREDAQPVVAWPGAQARRYRDTIYLMAAGVGKPAPEEPIPLIGDHLALPSGLGEIMLLPDSDVGLSDAVIEQGLEVRFRQGGEEIRPIFQQHTKKLKKLLQEEGVVPWMRDRLPLLYSGGKLVAVADLWVSDEASGEPGFRVRWRDHPALY